MKENANDATPSQVAPHTISPKEFNRRLTLLKAEVGPDFPNLIPSLESGLQVVLVTDDRFGKDLNPDILRRLGGMTTICGYFGAAVVFVNESKLMELCDGAESKS